jgi:uroporphyrinogen decarboxylase
MVDAFAACGYDYTTVWGRMSFRHTAHKKKETISLNEGSVIFDRETFENYEWPDPALVDYSHFERIQSYLPGNMKLMVAGPNGVLENVVDLVGYDRLCIMIYEDENLVQDIFDKVGSILLEYYEITAQFDSVGIIMSNDDWGFKTQTMLSPKHLRKYVFPWHRKIVQTAHKYGKPAVLHSCGFADEIMDDIIYDMGYDGKHSFEDSIRSIEDCYEKWGGKIALLGGLDIDFLIRSSEEDVTRRAKNLLAMAKDTGGYALGSGNSIPAYIPNEKYFAMTAAVLD